MGKTVKGVNGHCLLTGEERKEKGCQSGFKVEGGKMIKAMECYGEIMNDGHVNYLKAKSSF